MGLNDPIERLSAGPVHFSHTGWAFVKVFPESRPSPDEDYYLIYDHPQSFEADTWIQKGLQPDFPACIMNAGYSSGWCQESFGVPLVATKILCRAKGDPYCRFIMAPPDRIEAHVEQYIAEKPDLARRMQSYTIPDFFSRKRLEEDLRRSEAQYRGICEASADAILILDTEGNIADVNPAACALYGHSRDEMLGRSATTIIHPDYHDILAQFERLHTAAGCFHAESVDRRSDGTLIDVEVHATSFHYERAPHLLAIVRDITQRREAESELATANKQLVEASHRAGMAEAGTNVLHNVGNVLNSVNVSAELIADRLRKSEIGDLARASDLMQAHSDDLASFLTHDDRGRHLPDFLRLISGQLAKEHASLMAEVQSLTSKVEHIKNIVSMQQSHASAGGISETISLPDLVDEAICVEVAHWQHLNIQIVRDDEEVPQVRLQKHGVLQILVNLLSNARHALKAADENDKRITIRIHRVSDGFVCVDIADNGIGIPRESLTRIFSRGFTNRKDGHGFGLHSSALTAQQLGGSLEAFSEGPGRGARFVLTLPVHIRDQNTPLAPSGNSMSQGGSESDLDSQSWRPRKSGKRGALAP